MSALPKGWVDADLIELVPHDGLMTDGDWVESKDQDPNGEIRLIQLADIGDGCFRDKSARFLTRQKAVELNCTYLRKGDVLIARMPDPLGRACLFPLDGKGKFVTVVDVCVLRLSEETISNRYITYLINSGAIRQQIEGFESGTTRKRISGKNLARIRLPIAPLAEQRRIVGKVEELFSELDEGVANLKQARAQLAVYRQALLKHAFEGHLTADWRSQHAPELESADQLLARIRAEREERYQQQLREWKKAKAKSDECSKPRELIPWTEMSADELADLPSLPSGWTWIPFSNLCQIIRNGISAKPTGDTGDKILRISAVRPMKVDLDDFRYMQGSEDEFEDYVLEVGDLLFTRYNGSRRFVGVCGHFRGTERRLFPDKLIQGRLGVEAVLPEFVEGAFSCGASRKFVESKIRTTAGQAGVSGGDIKAVPVPVCSLSEQKEIVRFLEESLPNIDALEADIDLNLQKAEALRQSILKKAFAGELVPQDPADEPAAALLARLRAEREAAAAKSAKKKPATPRRAKA